VPRPTLPFMERVSGFSLLAEGWGGLCPPHPRGIERMRTMEEAQILHTAQEAIRQGNREAGRRLLAQLLRVNPRNEAAWLWLSAVVDDPEQERECVQRALRLKDWNALQEAKNPR
jgi:hypothetical protein